MIAADALLAGPRGRRMLLELALASEQQAQLSDHEDSLRLATFWVSHDLDPNPGTIFTAFVPEGQQENPPPRPTLSPDDVARRLADVPLADVTPELLRVALAQAVDTARYWQDPDGEDVLAATAPVRRELVRVAEHVVRSPHTAWWSAAADHNDQWSVTWVDDDHPTPEPSDDDAVRLRTWREHVVAQEAWAERERPRDPAAMFSGEWWSCPPPTLTRSTRSLPDGSPAGLWFVEDSFGWERASVHRVTVPEDTPVYEIDGAAAWADLCRRFPIEVTAQKRHDWYRTTGRDGRWVMPDWSRVAEQYAGVHLTAAAYVAAAGTAITVDDRTASVIAGWNVDETCWFTDAVRLAADPQRWIQDRSTEHPTWAPTSAQAPDAP